MGPYRPCIIRVVIRGLQPSDQVMSAWLDGSGRCQGTVVGALWVAATGSPAMGGDCVSPSAGMRGHKRPKKGVHPACIVRVIGIRGLQPSKLDECRSAQPSQISEACA